MNLKRLIKNALKKKLLENYLFDNDNLYRLYKLYVITLINIIEKRVIWQKTEKFNRLKKIIYEVNNIEE